MGLGLIHLVSQWAGATAVVAVLGCIIAAALGAQFSGQPLGPAADAFRLARLMALMGGISVIVAAGTSTFYWWWVGVASTAAAAAIGAALVVATFAFAVATRLLFARGHRAGS